MKFSIIFKLTFLLVPYVYALSPLSLTKSITDGFGVNIHFTHPKAGELEMIAAAGFKWVRVDFHWEAIETKKGEYNFNNYEFLMNELQKHNMSAYFILDYGNTLYDKNNSVITEVGRKAYAQWAATGVEHFKGRGIIWEIWNEPNINGFWNNHPDVHQYTAMALEAVKAIRAKTPNELIIGPATSSIDLHFLEECFKEGLLNYWDAVSVHPYRQTRPENVLSEYKALKNLIAKHAPKGKNIPIISGEWGYSAVWNHFDATIQGKYLTRELLTNVLNGIPVSIWYDWLNDGTNMKEPEHNFGIVENEYHFGANPVYTPKDAYLSAKTMNTVLKGYHFVKRIAINDANDYVLLFSDGKNLRLVVWTLSSIEHEIMIPSDNCDFEIINPKGSPVEKTSAKDGSLKLKLNDLTHFIVVKGPNHLLETAVDVLFKAVVEPIHGKTLYVRIEQIIGIAADGTVRLNDIKGIDPTITEMKFHFTNETEIVLNFPLKAEPENEFTVGLRVEGKGTVQNIPQHKYHFLSGQTITDCMITPDGDKNVKSEQSVSVHSSPEPLFDSDLPVLKIDCQFYGKGWKFMDIFPNKSENRKIPDQPKGFGVWIYGDDQGMTIKMRITDASHQTFQLRSESVYNINWKGWKYVEMYLKDHESYWGGPNNGVISYPVEYQTLLLLDNPTQSVFNSTIYMTAPLIIY
jgi:hypothetical protein